MPAVLDLSLAAVIRVGVICWRESGLLTDMMSVGHHVVSCSLAPCGSPAPWTFSPVILPLDLYQEPSRERRMGKRTEQGNLNKIQSAKTC